jgi:hypothetical protein
MRLEITPEMAAGLWDHLSDEFGSEIVDKDDSKLMRVVGWALDAFGILDKESFLENYGTTLIDTIYLPFAPGEVSQKWTPVKQCSMAIHEHHHVYQCNDVGAVIFSTGYLAKKSSRAHYEAEAYRTNLEFRWWLLGEMGSPTYYAEKIRNYGCGDNEVAFIEKFLEMSVPIIEAGEFTSPVTESAIKWLEANRRR